MITDQIGTCLTFDKTPQRIICFVPSLSELLVDLGLENSLVGVTKFCVHPKGLRSEKTIVGGTKNIKIDKITALQPDIIICNKEENTKQIVVNCNKVAPTYVSDIYSIADVLHLIRDFGVLFSCVNRASTLCDEIIAKQQDFENFTKGKSVLKVAYFIWKKPYMVAGSNTFINYILELNKLENVYVDLERYPEIALESLYEKDVDVVLLSSEPYPFTKKDCLEFETNFNLAKVELVDGEFFSWYGSRLTKAFDYFKNLRKILDSNFSI